MAKTETIKITSDSFETAVGLTKIQYDSLLDKISFMENIYKTPQQSENWEGAGLDEYVKICTLLIALLNDNARDLCFKENALHQIQLEFENLDIEIAESMQP